MVCVSIMANPCQAIIDGSPEQMNVLSYSSLRWRCSPVFGAIQEATTHTNNETGPGPHAPKRLQENNRAEDGQELVALSSPQAPAKEAVGLPLTVRLWHFVWRTRAGCSAMPPAAGSALKRSRQSHKSAGAVRAANQIGGLLRDHDRRCIGVAANDARHH